MREHDKTNTIIYYFEEMPEQFRSVNTQVLKICLDDFNVIALETIPTQKFLGKYIATGYTCIRILKIDELMVLLAYFAPIAREELGKQKIWMSNSKSIYDYTRNEIKSIMYIISRIIISTIRFGSFENFDILVYPIEYYKRLAQVQTAEEIKNNEPVFKIDHPELINKAIRYVKENVSADTIEIHTDFVVLAKKY